MQDPRTRRSAAPPAIMARTGRAVGLAKLVSRPRGTPAGYLTEKVAAQYTSHARPAWRCRCVPPLGACLASRSGRREASLTAPRLASLRSHAKQCHSTWMRQIKRASQSRCLACSRMRLSLWPLRLTRLARFALALARAQQHAAPLRSTMRNGKRDGKRTNGKAHCHQPSPLLRSEAAISIAAVQGSSPGRGSPTHYGSRRASKCMTPSPLVSAAPQCLPRHQPCPSMRCFRTRTVPNHALAAGRTVCTCHPRLSSSRHRPRRTFSAGPPSPLRSRGRTAPRRQHHLACSSLQHVRTMTCTVIG
mmetsp:Transcript_37772/g.80430  ORF Transcript_37772/g.80430 Transcript_37772/m.80430 type:complete len:304 (+) Transcript_37772:265-1176(+)